MLKIAIVGPESTGKSELSKALAAHYGGVFVPEYARSYVEQLDREYNWDDVCQIARKQIEEQAVYLNSACNQPIVFFDTELIITKVWLEHCYQQVPEFVEHNISSGYYDFYLLCYPDLPWVYDPVREHGGDERMYFFQWYKREIEKTGIAYAIIKGEGENRAVSAINEINTRFII
ncbi:MAG: ATP-binding protein [Paludibacter sp.]|nr:ATP-binding protein [Paludibacter sp.]